MESKQLTLQNERDERKILLDIKNNFSEVYYLYLLYFMSDHVSSVDCLNKIFTCHTHVSTSLRKKTHVNSSGILWKKCHAK